MNHSSIVRRQHTWRRFRLLRIPLVALSLIAGIVSMNAEVASAESTPSNIALPPQAFTDCTGDTPIMVASDIGAQSDIYSAVTLAGVLGSDCIILAGPRDESMPEEQRRRLESANHIGYIVGGEGAVPLHKHGNVGCRQLPGGGCGSDLPPSDFPGPIAVRIGGSDRWQTARIVGEQARRIASGYFAEITSSHSSNGAETTSADCSGNIPIMVASDERAVSDRYSAITLAGILGTDCIVLAGARDGAMGLTQRLRLANAQPGGYVIGGASSVSSQKIAGRAMIRIQGSDRWQTAHLAGREAYDIAYREIHGGLLSVSGRSACALLADRTAACWGSHEFGATAVPSGTFLAVTTGAGGGCGLRDDLTLECWPNNAETPSGQYSGVDAGSSHVCAVSRERSVVCWGLNDDGQTESPAGDFLLVSSGDRHTCGLRLDRSVDCWGGNRDGQADAPEGRFVSISAGGRLTCGIRINRSIQCWGYVDEVPDEYRSDVSTVPFAENAVLSTGYDQACALRATQDLTCWGSNEDEYSRVPNGRFVAIAAGRNNCALRPSREVVCWNSYTDQLTTSPYLRYGAPFSPDSSWGCGSVRCGSAEKPL